MTSVPSVALNNGVQMPQLGFGVFQVSGQQIEPAITTALAAGYRSIDTAIYGNEDALGETLQRAGLARQELFLTSKVWNADQGFDSTLRAFDASLACLRTDYLDLYLIHWPAPARNRYPDTWKALERLYAEQRVGPHPDTFNT